ncbi:hypothetical protein STCU_11341 [Strigomonas culicis]|uniref:Uncharacterized protein n=1 Tax=Strigomonas culicis TaxID=28005 RepID=S9TJ19_9TRYP|nr:hypothetical protein STCU_11341 [Strigomonas culicis]|eukprot:EPY16378.1 hypothetical protein STCU_11341 [Strigomonas culicis]
MGLFLFFCSPSIEISKSKQQQKQKSRKKKKKKNVVFVVECALPYHLFCLCPPCLTTEVQVSCSDTESIVFFLFFF